MENGNDKTPSAAQIAAYRSLWTKLLAPFTPDDDEQRKAHNTADTRSNDQQPRNESDSKREVKSNE